MEKTTHHFLTHLNNQHENVKFATEVDKYKMLPFLCVLVIKKQDNTLGHIVYRKPAPAHVYSYADSHRHHPAQINSVIKTLMKRTEVFADENRKKTGNK